MSANWLSNAPPEARRTKLLTAEEATERARAEDARIARRKSRGLRAKRQDPPPVLQEWEKDWSLLPMKPPGGRP